MLRSAVIAVVVLLAVAWPLAASTPPAPDTRALKKVGDYKLLSPRQGAAVVAVGSHLYVLGGADESGLIDFNERFDVRTNRSERIAATFLPRRYHRALEFRNRIYLFGGSSATSRTQHFEAAVEIYDLATGTVSRGKPMDSPRAHLAAARIGNVFFFAGGAKQREEGRIVHTGEAHFYEPGRDTWTKAPPMPTPREGHAVVAGTMFIVAGGYSGTAARSEVEFFVPQENAWKALPPLPRSVSAHSVALLEKYLFIFGDYADLDLVLAYDLATRKTSRVAVDFKGLRHTAAVAHEGRIYVVGGNTAVDGYVSDLIQVFALAK